MCFINGWMSLVPNVCEIITLTVLSGYRFALIIGQFSFLFHALPIMLQLRLIFPKTVSDCLVDILNRIQISLPPQERLVGHAGTT